MRLRSTPILVALATLTATLPAAAEGHRGVSRHAGIRYVPGTYGTGFAQPFIQGDYVDAPFTVIPRPDHLVPTPWSYGTYGVPTLSGIAPAPVGPPTLTVIHAEGGRRSARRMASPPDEFLADTRVLNVSVPRR